MRALDGSFRVAAGAKQRELQAKQRNALAQSAGESPIDNTVLPNIMSADESRILLLGTRIKHLLIRRSNVAAIEPTLRPVPQGSARVRGLSQSPRLLAFRRTRSHGPRGSHPPILVPPVAVARRQGKMLVAIAAATAALHAGFAALPPAELKAALSALPAADLAASGIDVETAAWRRLVETGERYSRYCRYSRHSRVAPPRRDRRVPRAWGCRVA